MRFTQQTLTDPGHVHSPGAAVSTALGTRALGETGGQAADRRGAGGTKRSGPARRGGERRKGTGERKGRAPGRGTQHGVFEEASVPGPNQQGVWGWPGSCLFITQTLGPPLGARRL